MLFIVSHTSRRCLRLRFYSGLKKLCLPRRDYLVFLGAQSDELNKNYPSRRNKAVILRLMDDDCCGLDDQRDTKGKRENRQRNLKILDSTTERTNLFLLQLNSFLCQFLSFVVDDKFTSLFLPQQLLAFIAATTTTIHYIYTYVLPKFYNKRIEIFHFTPIFWLRTICYHQQHYS